MKAGLEGIKQKLQAPPPVEEDVFEFDDTELVKKNIEVLPDTLGEAIKEMKNSSIVAELFGDEFLKKYIRAKTEEWDNFRVNVTEWEIRNYLEIV